VILTSQARYGGTAKSDIIAELVRQVAVPT